MADDNQLRVDALRGLCDAMLSDDPASDVQERLQSGRMLAAEMLGILNGPRPLPDHDNHHNAAMCPYCTDNGRFVSVTRADVAHLMYGTREQQDEAFSKLREVIGE